MSRRVGDDQKTTILLFLLRHTLFRPWCDDLRLSKYPKQDTLEQRARKTKLLTHITHQCYSEYQVGPRLRPVPFAVTY